MAEFRIVDVPHAPEAPARLSATIWMPTTSRPPRLTDYASVTLLLTGFP